MSNPLDTDTLPVGDFAYYGEYFEVAEEDWDNRSAAWKVIKKHYTHYAEELEKQGKKPLGRLERFDKAPVPHPDKEGLWGTVGWRQKWSK
jgi:hypothetical protein